MDALFPATDCSLTAAVATVAAGSWAVGVSGGADSVALLLLLRDRPDLALRVVHIDHQLRGADSEADAAFVVELSRQCGLPCHAFLRTDIERSMPSLPRNPSAHYRAVRLEAFARVVTEHSLNGVILAHHADDVAETVLQRLLRGSSAAGLRGIASTTTLGPLTIIRPLLSVHRSTLRQFLADRKQPWREDTSNASGDYLRNRLRRALAGRPETVDALLELGSACQAWTIWLRATAPTLPARFAIGALAGVPEPLGRESARRWLTAAGALPDELPIAVLDRLRLMASDAATPARQEFPGALAVRRHAGVIEKAQS